jgi:hypothetical protein
VHRELLGDMPIFSKFFEELQVVSKLEELLVFSQLEEVQMFRNLKRCRYSANLYPKGAGIQPT